MYSRSCRNTAMTLIEVLAGLVLLSTLLASIVIASGRFAARIRGATNELASVEILEDQLAFWYASAGRLPSAAEGRIDGAPEYRWRIIRSNVPVAPNIPARRVRVELFVPGGGAPGMSIELLEPIEDRDRAAHAGGRG